MTRRTQKEPNENGIGRGRIRHTPKGDLQHKCRRGSGPPLELVMSRMTRVQAMKGTKSSERFNGPNSASGSEDGRSRREKATG